MAIHYDTEVTARSTMPDAMLTVYNNSEPVPDLNSLNVFRDDGKMSLKFYTNPSFFFELWKEEMHKELESKKRRKVCKATLFSRCQVNPIIKLLYC